MQRDLDAPDRELRHLSRHHRRAGPVLVDQRQRAVSDVNRPAAEREAILSTRPVLRRPQPHGGARRHVPRWWTRHSLAVPTPSRRRTCRRRSFTATQVTGRLEYAFSTRADFLGFAQYQNEERRADFNLRFHWIPKIGDDLYVVWNSGFTTDPGAPWRFPARRALRTR